MAKLGEIKFQKKARPRSLGPEAAVQEYENKQRINRAFQEVGTSLAELATTNQRTDASQKLTDSITEFDKEHADREGYTAGEVMQMEGVETERDILEMDGDEFVPAWRVRPQLLEHHLRTTIEEQSRNIYDKRARDAWTAKAEMQAARMVQSAVERAGREQMRYTLDMGRMKVEQAQDSAAFDLAAEHINEMPVTQDMKDLLLADNAQMREGHRLFELSNGDDYAAMWEELGRIRDGDTPLNPVAAEKAEAMLLSGYKRARDESVKQEAAPWYAAMRNEDDDQLAEHIEYLRSDDYSGNLDDAQRHTWIARLTAARVDLGKRGEAERKRQQQDLKRTYSSLNASIADGHYPDPANQQELVTVARSLVNADDTPEGLRTQALDYLEAIAFMPQIMEQQRLSPADQEARIAEVRNLEVPAEQEDDRLALLRQLERTQAQTRRAIESDSMQFALSTGQVQVQLPTDPTADGFFEGLIERDAAEQALFERYGGSTGLLTADEADNLQGWMAGASMRDLRTFSQMVNLSLGDRAHLLWEQLVDAGGGVLAVAGRVEPHIATQILAGRDIRADADFTPAELRTMRNLALGSMGSAYGENTLERKAVADAAVNYQLAMQRTGQEVSMEAAVEAVTGPLVQFNGVTFNAPEQGVTSEDMRHWVAAMTADDLPMITVDDQEAVLLQLQSGGINLVPAGGGRFLMQRLDTGQFLQQEGGGRAQLEWPSLEEVIARWEADPRGYHESMSRGYMPESYSAQDPVGDR